MRKLLLYYVIGQLLFLTSSVEPLEGTKIVSVGIYDVPSIASLQYLNGKHFCSGIVITNRHVITATHCLDSKHTNHIKIALGTTDLRVATVRYAIASWVSYNLWAIARDLKEKQNVHDISIVTILGKIEQPGVSPIRLTNLNKQQIQGKPTTIIGWDLGKKKLQKAEVTVLSDEDCLKNRYLVTNIKRRKMYEAHLCTAARPPVLLGGGDSGGPLLDTFGDLIGVHRSVGPHTKFAWGNFSEKFIQQYQINAHSNVAYYLQFIVNVTGYNSQNNEC